MEDELTQKGAPEETPSPEVSLEEKKLSKEAKTYSEDEIEKLVQSRSDKLTAQLGYKAAEAERQLETLKQDYEDSQRQIQELTAEIERKEDEAFSGDPEGLSAVRAKREAYKAKKALAQEKKELAQRETALGIVLKEQAIASLAKQYDIEPEVFQIASSYQEAENLAKAIERERQKHPKPGGPEKPGFTPDTGVSDAGSGRVFTHQSIADMSVEEYEANKKAIDKAWREGRIK